MRLVARARRKVTLRFFSHENTAMKIRREGWLATLYTRRAGPAPRASSPRTRSAASSAHRGAPRTQTLSCGLTRSAGSRRRWASGGGRRPRSAVGEYRAFCAASFADAGRGGFTAGRWHTDDCAASGSGAQGPRRAPACTHGTGRRAMEKRAGWRHVAGAPGARVLLGEGFGSGAECAALEGAARRLEADASQVHRSPPTSLTWVQVLSRRFPGQNSSSDRSSYSCGCSFNQARVGRV